MTTLLTALLLLAAILGALKGYLGASRPKGLGYIDRQRAEAAALRAEMDLHPVERA